MIATGENKLMTIGNNCDVVDSILMCYERFKDQPKSIIKKLKESDYNIDGKCQSIFAYLTDNVRYRIDPNGIQQIKSPARLLDDGEGDCKSLTMFIVCCLHCLGISHIIRFVSFDETDEYTHVYAVALDEQGEEIILDACETDSRGISRYDYARPYVKKQDYIYYEQA